MLTYLSARLNLPHLPRRQLGLTTVEYAIAGALIVIAIVAAFGFLKGQLQTGVNNIGTQIK